MLHTKFSGNRTFGPEKIFEGFFLYGHGSHLGHMTSIITTIFYFLVSKSLHVKFGSKRPSGF